MDKVRTPCLLCCVYEIRDLYPHYGQELQVEDAYDKGVYYKAGVGGGITVAIFGKHGGLSSDHSYLQLSCRQSIIVSAFTFPVSCSD